MERLPPYAVTALLALANAYMCHPPSQVLGHEGDPYLERWWLAKDRTTGSVYIHHMLRSDQDPELHDHPGDNLSIILKGEMLEHTPSGIRRWVPGDIVARRAADRHRIEISEPIVTMWIMGERTREWGFWTDDGAFVPSQEFFRQRGYF